MHVLLEGYVWKNLQRVQVFFSFQSFNLIEHQKMHWEMFRKGRALSCVAGDSFKAVWRTVKTYFSSRKGPQCRSLMPS